MSNTMLDKVIQNILKGQADNITKVLEPLVKESLTDQERANIVTAICSAVLVVRDISKSLKEDEFINDEGAEGFTKALINAVNTKKSKRGQ